MSEHKIEATVQADDVVFAITQPKHSLVLLMEYIWLCVILMDKEKKALMSLIVMSKQKEKGTFFPGLNSNSH